ncbi:hypothetical protein GCM10023143_28130 [Compostibacter hankyongensis]|uniref:RagB/SusD family nutrient uptake outer membrane protein n=1 Tax=Compostibacter hankyongensis TaxID=1007089 RepID=A0ABP8G327_9BACT
MLLLAFCLAAACKKDDDKPAPEDKPKPGAELVKAVGEEVSAVDSLSSFAVYLGDLELSDAEAAAGVTVFAPVNSAFANASARLADPRGGQLREKLPDSSDLEDYVVKGIVGVDALTNGKKLTSLSGNTLTVTTEEGGDVRINGVLLSGKSVASGEKSVVHSLAGLLKKNPSLTVTVWDASRWTAAKPRGEVSAEATVSLYRTREDYASGKPPAYTAKTASNGEAKFKNLEAGTYYIVAQQEDKSSIFRESGLWSETPVEGVYLGYASDTLFQTQAEIDNGVYQAGAAQGNFRYLDANGDGRIDMNDFVALPYQSVVAEQGGAVSISILVGYSNNAQLGPLPDIAAAGTLLDAVYQAAAADFLTGTLLDGYLSDDAEANSGSWAAIDHFGFTPADNVFTGRWSIAYQSIMKLNRILRDVPEMAASSDKNTVIAQARALRAHIYLRLLAYFGNVPQLSGVIIPPDFSNGNSQQVYDDAIADLKAAVDVLPAKWDAQHAYKLSKGAANALLAKAYLMHKDYGNAANYARVVINSGTYQLLHDIGDVFKDNVNKEVIWDISDQAASAEFINYFARGTHCPIVRLGELYLIASESLLEKSGVSAEVVSDVTMLRIRQGMTAVSAGMTAAEIRAALREVWQKEMYREGSRFLCLQRWGIAQQVLGSKGYHTGNDLLPIPQNYMNLYPGIRQNPGY